MPLRHTDFTEHLLCARTAVKTLTRLGEAARGEALSMGTLRGSRPGPPQTGLGVSKVLAEEAIATRRKAKPQR